MKRKNRSYREFDKVLPAGMKAFLLGSVLMVSLTGCQVSGNVWEEKTEVLTEKETEAPVTETKTTGTETEEPKMVKPVTIFVDVGGAVVSPGVVELPGDARVFQAIEAAGGLLDDAGTKSLNLASIVGDGDKIWVYTREEEEQAEVSGETAQERGDPSFEGSGTSALLNLNTATKEQLMSLPGIGESKALAILSYREMNGGFTAIEDIMNVSGIKNAVFEQIRTLVTVS